MYQIVRSDDEIHAQMDRAFDGLDRGSKYPGLSFEEGVQQMFDWLTGQSSEPPFE